eukprot:1159154-Pelagomonas_calceolata.AAC.3
MIRNRPAVSRFDWRVFAAVTCYQLPTLQLLRHLYLDLPQTSHARCGPFHIEGKIKAHTQEVEQQPGMIGIPLCAVAFQLSRFKMESASFGCVSTKGCVLNEGNS